MSTPPHYKYTPEQTAAQRAQVQKEHVEPVVRATFERHSALHSAMFLLAQCIRPTDDVMRGVAGMSVAGHPSRDAEES
ncbi:hypothetical protein HUW62_10975 [Myxococcus sp. AM011]|uniref:hypothetical protein n=1 Tax=Myxococcus sp. AM011 TaxID=2745200 RepID=UPI0015963716|nr:hypothetical protein [Myxococcus sp. AM011]NVJ21740.1 hypothetical protein [Myxococcus sp. AM011]